jgi:polyhydroxybutyrate depolymerase
MKYTEERLKKFLCLKGFITIFLIMLLAACGGGGSNTPPKVKEITPIANVPNDCSSEVLNENTSCIELNGRKSFIYQENDQLKDGVALFLHGAPGSASKVMGIFNAEMIANKHNLIAVSPEGTSDQWGWLSTNNLASDTNSDVDYLNELIIKIRGDLNITSDRLYIFGYSAGGFMAYKLACAIPEQISAVVSLAGQYRGDLDACNHSTPVSIHHFHSLSDQEVSYYGRDDGNIQSVSDTISLWQDKNGCDADAEEKEQVGVTVTSSKTTTFTYNNCLASVALSRMDLVKHEADYLSENLYQIYQSIFNN